MPIRYRVQPSNFTEGKYQAYPVPLGVIETARVIADIVQETGLSSTDVYAVLDALSRHTARWLATGYRVRLEGLGTFSVSMRGTLPTPDALVKDSECCTSMCDRRRRWCGRCDDGPSCIVSLCRIVSRLSSTSAMWLRRGGMSTHRVALPASTGDGWISTRRRRTRGSSSSPRMGWRDGRRSTPCGQGGSLSSSCRRRCGGRSGWRCARVAGRRGCGRDAMRSRWCRLCRSLSRPGGLRRKIPPGFCLDPGGILSRSRRDLVSIPPGYCLDPGGILPRSRRDFASIPAGFCLDPAGILPRSRRGFVSIPPGY